MSDKKRDKFVTLAENRVNKAIRYIRLVGNLSNRNNYIFTENDVRQIFNALENEIRNTKKRFDSSSESCEKNFTLE